MKIAAVQMDVRLGDISRNLDSITARLRETASAGARLTVFPECAVTGYCFDSADEAAAQAQAVTGPAVAQIAQVCAELNVFAIFGMLEADGGCFFNAAVLAGPAGVIGSYRKVHLPYLGADRFATFGNRPFAVHEAGDVKIGMNICYDAALPESARCLTLLGADLIALPTNWPPGAECVADFVINTRAMENAVYFAACNRVGLERGFRFIGRSRICAPNGSTLASAPHDDEAILYVDIDPSVSRNKKVAREPGRHALDRLADRRPDMYSLLTKPHSLPRPGDR